MGESKEINNKWGISMRLDKLNDWVKVLVAQLIAGIFTIIFLEIYFLGRHKVSPIRESNQNFVHLEEFWEVSIFQD